MGRVRLFAEKSAPELIRLLAAVAKASDGAAPPQARAAANMLAQAAKTL